ncbi:MAG: four helix bundle protein [Patescibacteria group bacterium]
MATGIENLRIWKSAHSLEIQIYKITAGFPKEAYYLRRVSQIRRAASSITDNIAESYGKFNYNNKIHSLYISRGELEEARSQLKGFVAQRYLEDTLANEIINEYTELLKGINSYINFLKKKQSEKPATK